MHLVLLGMGTALPSTPLFLAFREEEEEKKDDYL